MRKFITNDSTILQALREIVFNESGIYISVGIYMAWDCCKLKGCPIHYAGSLFKKAIFVGRSHTQCSAIENYRLQYQLRKQFVDSAVCTLGAYRVTARMTPPEPSFSFTSHSFSAVPPPQASLAQLVPPPLVETRYSGWYRISTITIFDRASD